MAAGYYPPWGFYYKVEFAISKEADDVRFQTVSGLSVEYDFETTIKKIYGIPELENFLGDRLRDGR